MLEDKLSKLNLKYDDFAEVSRYYARTIPGDSQYWYYNERSFILPYIQENGNEYTLRVIANYYGDDWIFIDSVFLKIDGQFYNPYIDLIEPDFDREVDYGNVSEYETMEIANLNNFAVLNNYYEILKRIPDSQRAVVRFAGNGGTEDLEISSKDKQAIREVLEAWELIEELY